MSVFNCAEKRSRTKGNDEWTQNNAKKTEVEILRIEEIDPKNILVSKDLITYNQKTGVSNDRSMGLALLLCQAILNVNNLYRRITCPSSV